MYFFTLLWFNVSFKFPYKIWINTLYLIRKEKQTLQQPNWNFLPFFQVLFLIEEYLTLLSLLSDYSRVEGSYSSSQLSQFQQFLLRADKYNSLDIFGNVATGKIILVEVLLHFFDWCYFAQSYNWKSLPPFHCQWKQRERGGGGWNEGQYILRF